MLFLGFNRPSLTQQVFAALRSACPPRLYIALDGPRVGVASDALNVSRVREVCAEVTWPCQVKTLIQEANLGCKIAVSSALDWFFTNETEGIILEDDCLPNPAFFDFCEKLLNCYRDERRVWCITGDNFQNGIKRGAASYYFSKYPHIWGWATWKRCWDAYNVDIPLWPKWRKSKQLRKLFPDCVERRHWVSVFDRAHAGEIDTWDFQWLVAVWMNNGLTATPQRNLVTNIGFGVEATHTKQTGSRLSIPNEGLRNPIVSPTEICAHEEADRYVFQTVFAPKVPTKTSVPQKITRKMQQMSQLTSTRLKHLLRGV